MAPGRLRDLDHILARGSRLSLWARGVGVLAVPLAALFAVLLTVLWSLGHFQEAEEAIDRAGTVRAQLAEARVSLADAQAAAAAYAATRDGRYLDGSRAAWVSLQKALDRLEPLVSGDAAEAAALRDVRQSCREAASLGAAPSGMLERLGALVRSAQAGLAALGRVQAERAGEAVVLRQRVRTRLQSALLVCGLLGCLGALLVHLILAGTLARDLRELQNNATRLAHGLPLEPSRPSVAEVANLAGEMENAAFLLRARETELRDRERRFRDLFDQAPVPYEETDRKGVVTRLNQAVCSLLRCPPERLLGRRAFDFAAPDRQEILHAAMLDRIRTGTETGPFECEYFLENGSWLSVEIRETLIRDGAGEVTGICRSLLDVTERNLAAVAARKVQQYALELQNRNEQLRRALDAARSATDAKSRFLAGISHELRTPLNSIIGFSELMYDGKAGPLGEQHREFLGDILTSARHLLRIINDILDLSKIEAGRMEFRPEPARIGALVSEVCDVVRALAVKKGLLLLTDVPSDLHATLDPSRFKQVLYNFLSNAVKFTPEGGRVTARVALEKSGFRLEVEDTGIGIAAGDLSLLFREFQQLTKGRMAEQGTGLGLALTRTIVEAQGGTVGVRSELGKGSVFWAVLPLDTTARVAAAR